MQLTQVDAIGGRPKLLLNPVEVSGNDPMLMGELVGPRREFIQSNALSVARLRVEGPLLLYV